MQYIIVSWALETWHFFRFDNSDILNISSDIVPSTTTYRTFYWLPILFQLQDMKTFLSFLSTLFVCICLVVIVQFKSLLKIFSFVKQTVRHQTSHLSFMEFFFPRSSLEFNICKFLYLSKALEKSLLKKNF